MRTSASSVHAMCLPIAQTHWAALRVPAFRAIAAMASIVKVSPSLSLSLTPSLSRRLVVIVVSISIGIMTDQTNQGGSQATQQSIQLKVQMIVVAHFVLPSTSAEPFFLSFCLSLSLTAFQSMI